MTRSFIIGLIKHGSLEVAFGAAVMSMAVAAVRRVNVPLSVHVALFLAVWFIYILDRLFDARKIGNPAGNPRHLFYQMHFPKMMGLLTIVGLAGLALLFFLPQPVLLYGVALMGACLLYLLVVFFSTRSLPKEFVIAVLYTSGVSLAPIALSQSRFSWADLLLALSIFLIALINLVLFSLLEQQHDIEDRQASAITWWKPRSVHRLLMTLFFAAVTITVALALSSGSFAVWLLQGTLLLMLLVLWVLYKAGRAIKNKALYRLVGDGVFLLPGILLF